MKQILIIDDDTYIGDILEKALLQNDYQVIRAYSGTEALLLLRQQKPDLILLDLMLPGLSGEEVLSKIQGIPVIVVSARVDINSKVGLLLEGAEDYITKPFEIKEVLARIQVQLRKNTDRSNNHLLCHRDLTLDTISQEAIIEGHPVKFTRTEFAILKLLMQNSKQVISKSSLLDKISLDTPDCTERSLKQHISNLRKKLQDVSGKDYIETVWGIGFKMAE